MLTMLAIRRATGRSRTGLGMGATLAPLSGSSDERQLRRLATTRGADRDVGLPVVANAQNCQTVLVVGTAVPIPVLADRGVVVDLDILGVGADLATAPSPEEGGLAGERPHMIDTPGESAGRRTPAAPARRKRAAIPSAPAVGVIPMREDAALELHDPTLGPIFLGTTVFIPQYFRGRPGWRRVGFLTLPAFARFVGCGTR